MNYELFFPPPADMRLSSDKPTGILTYQRTQVNNKTTKIFKILVALRLPNGSAKKCLFCHEDAKTRRIEELNTTP